MPLTTSDQPELTAGGFSLTDSTAPTPGTIVSLPEPTKPVSGFLAVTEPTVSGALPIAASGEMMVVPDPVVDLTSPGSLVKPLEPIGRDPGVSLPGDQPQPTVSSDRDLGAIESSTAQRSVLHQHD